MKNLNHTTELDLPVESLPPPDILFAEESVESQSISRKEQKLKKLSKKLKKSEPDLSKYLSGEVSINQQEKLEARNLPKWLNKACKKDPKNTVLEVLLEFQDGTSSRIELKNVMVKRFVAPSAEFLNDSRRGSHDSGMEIDSPKKTDQIFSKFILYDKVIQKNFEIVLDGSQFSQELQTIFSPLLKNFCKNLQ